MKEGRDYEKEKSTGMYAYSNDVDERSSNDNINREQMATMMYNYAKSEGYDVSARKILDLLQTEDMSVLMLRRQWNGQWRTVSPVVRTTEQD